MDALNLLYDLQGLPDDEPEDSALFAAIDAHIEAPQEKAFHLRPSVGSWLRIPRASASKPFPYPPYVASKPSQAVEKTLPMVAPSPPVSVTEIIPALPTEEMKSKVAAAMETAPVVKSSKLHPNQRCRPGSLADYKSRLATFSPATWFNKPLGASPIECARRGLVNDGLDTVVCEICRLRSKWDVMRDSKCTEDSAASWLGERHERTCPWRSQVVHKSDPNEMSDAELLKAYQVRLRSLQEGLSFVPVVADDIARDVLQGLAALGWEYKGEQDSTQLLGCTFCLRTVPVQSFSHVRHERIASQPVRSSSDGKRNAISALPTSVKRRRLQAPGSRDCHRIATRLAGMLSGAEHVEGEPESGDTVSDTETTNCKAHEAEQVVQTQEVLPPCQGLWTPSRRLPHLQADSRTEVRFDSSYLHRWYCYCFSGPGLDYASLALRILDVVEQAESNSGEPHAGETVRKDESVSAALHRAEQLLGSLDQLLPPLE